MVDTLTATEVAAALFAIASLTSMLSNPRFLSGGEGCSSASLLYETGEAGGA